MSDEMVKQKTELTFIVQCFNPLSRKWTDVYYSRCGIKQHNYTEARTGAYKVLSVLQKYDSTYRVITKYLPYTESRQNLKQLKLFEV